ncbi:BTB/POZ and MATH domain-containing protein 1-like [Panicum virgatum]|uniref:MATH domain-containing protein n=1 Tax=Panicum virgatum TaxID=38727 RepID=A0A8T0SGH6_PANVG|nr:BTB/POZ and MATH domain-containing protein 1-like [Panicum virgatum]KAG2597641.1 hypothetical protein PVAP13_5KG242700 [Panicum virgatum]
MRPWDGIVSASSISTTAAATGCHVLKINGYSEAKMAMSNGSLATSSEFEAAGYTWYIRYYPNGMSSYGVDHISLYLRLADRHVGTTLVNARFRFSLIPPHGGDGPWWRRWRPRPRPYSESAAAEFGHAMHSSGPGFPRFIRRDALERSGYIQDDCFAIRCDIHVVSTT